MECSWLVVLTFSVCTQALRRWANQSATLIFFPPLAPGRLHWALGKIFSRVTHPLQCFHCLALASPAFYGWNTFSALYVLPGLTITAGQRTLSRQTSGFSVILTRYAIKWSEKKKKKKNIFAQLRFKKTSIVFYFMCFLLVRLVRLSDYRFWLESRETWLSYNFSGRSIQSATVQRPCCHDDDERWCILDQLWRLHVVLSKSHEKS